MAFACDFSHIEETSATFNGTFTGGDSGYSGYRYVRLTVDGVGTYQVRSSSAGGSISIFSKVISGLEPSTRYTWDAQLGYVDGGSIIWLDLYDSGSFTTLSSGVDIDPWYWNRSNGSASSSETSDAYSVLLGDLPANYFSHLVWNDLVDKVYEMRSALGYTWDTANGKYPTRSGCYVSAGDTLSARIYNGVRYNIGSVKTTGITDRQSGDRITGTLIVTLTDVLNDIINNGV